MRSQRIEASIFLPEEISEVVDEVRRRWNPTQVSRIAPHLCVLHHAESAQALSARLEQLSAALSPFPLHLGRAERWPDPDRGVYIAADDPEHGLSRLRNLLAGVATRPRTGPFTPHVTLVHPATVSRAMEEHAWASLQFWCLEETFTVREISVVESTPVGWYTSATYALAGGPSESRGDAARS